MRFGGWNIARYRGRWYATDGMFGERGDPQTAVEPNICGHGGTVADEQVLVAEHALVALDDAMVEVGRDHGAAEEVRSGGDVSARCPLTSRVGMDSDAHNRSPKSFETHGRAHGTLLETQCQ